MTDMLSAYGANDYRKTLSLIVAKVEYTYQDLARIRLRR
jgi:hypothetical protein